MLADPVFEMARVWKLADRTLGELEGELLHPALVAALDGATSERMPRDRFPYVHQVAAWKASATGKSCLVTSGTGSGKTECFMVPMLDDLVRLAEQGGGRGVRAIVIYPLNALIESQRERLAAWTTGIRGKVSFALYNGLTPEDPRRIQGRLAAAEIGDRRSIRTTPPSILITNVTMLEYLLLRAKDQPILEKSKGLLRWIVLDEAHGYVGAQAAEMALLLRRVRAAFGVDPDEVRLMATSATISEGELTREKLARFVADLAGVGEDRIAVIEGQEATPRLPALGPDDPLEPAALEALDPASLWGALAPHPRMRAARDILAKRPARLEEIGRCLADRGGVLALPAVQDLLDLAARVRSPETGHRLIPWRAHLFHRSQGGFWICVDPECRHRDPELVGAGAAWGFGALWLRQRDRCDCGAQVFELVACCECGTAHLVAGARYGATTHLVSLQTGDFDDFQVDYEPDPIVEDETQEATDDQPTGGVADTVWLRPGAGAADEVHLRLADGRVFENGPPQDAASVRLRLIERERGRGCCGRAAETALMPQRYGPAFLAGSAIPLTLEELAPPLGLPGLPMGGRRTLTFSDSRQGTARLAARLQQEAERHLTRAFLYHSVQQGSGPTSERRAQLEQKLARMRPYPQDFQGDIRAAEEELAGGAKPVSWPDLVSDLARHTELTHFATRAWEGRGWRGNDMAKDPERLVQMFLYRELFRRPRVQNNAETMGLVRLFFPDLEHRARAAVPDPLREAGYDGDAWAGLVHAAVDLGFRENLAVEVSPDWIVRWASPRGGGLNAMTAPGTPPDQRPPRSRPWPSAKPGSFPISRLARLIYRLIDGDPSLPVDQDRAREVLQAAWELITSTVGASAGMGAWRVDFRKAAVVRIENGWLCPVTRRILGATTGGPSPYGAEDSRLLEPLRMPRLPIADPAQPAQADRDRIRDWLQADEDVEFLRGRGIWSDLHDRIATFDPFFLAQEHSAQIQRPVLQAYEARFKKGEINVLNCSTTMEMGVDIPNVALVVNANLPPSISNYRQRVGRAGRRGEEWAFGMTFCRDLPLDRMAFDDPAGFLQAPIAAPAVRLDSETIVMRHVNAALLAAHLRGLGNFRIGGSCREFFGAQDEPQAPFAPDSTADGFIAALQGPMRQDAGLGQDLERLTRGTVLEGRTLPSLCAEVATVFEELLRRWQREYVELVGAAAAAAENEVKQSYRLRARRMAGEFLIGELARRGFTPAYGFPVDVVSFDHLSGKVDESDPVLAFGERRGGASRKLDVAIREYAPGAEIVLDGLVHASEGVQPAWAAMADTSGLEDLQTFWECPRCRAFGIVRTDLHECPRCQAEAPRLTRVLRPAGFLGRRVPHTGYERLAHAPYETPRISASGGAWLALPDPAAGRMRGDPAGTVITMSSGPAESGFALCLCCGRAVAEASDIPGQPMPEAIRRHRPLAPVRGMALVDGHCPGGFRDANRVQRHLRLGHESRTDVFEFQCPAGASRAAALGLAAGLREAVADRLGVEAREIGVSAAHTLGPAGEDRVSALLFDRASGGTGLVTRLTDDDWFETAVTFAADRLDCRERCDAGCPNCVLRPDLNMGSFRLDRRAALALAGIVRGRLDLPAGHRLFGDETRMAGAALAAGLDRLRARGRLRKLDLFLHGAVVSWDLSAWPVEAVLARCAENGVEVAICMASAALDGGALEAAQKLDVYRLAARGGAALLRLDQLPLTPSGKPLLAVAETTGGLLGFATADDEAVPPGPDWGSGAAAPVVQGPVAPVAAGAPVELEKLLVRATGNSHLVWVGREIDGPAPGFGRRFWQLMSRQAPDFVQRLQTDGVAEATYTDRYLQTPITVRLLAEVLAAMPGRLVDTRLLIRSARAAGQRKPGWAIHHSFDEDGIRKAVIAEVLGISDIAIQDRRQLPHARSLELRLASGATVRVLLDQGFGAWRTDETRHDFRASPKIQAASIRKLAARVFMEHLRGSPVILEKHAG